MLEKSEITNLAKDFLTLSDVDFMLKHSHSKSDVEKKLNDDEKLSKEFDAAIEECFSKKLNRDCAITISQFMEDLKTPKDEDVNERRVTQQTIQTLMMIKKSVESSRPKAEDSSLASILDELEG